MKLEDLYVRAIEDCFGRQQQDPRQQVERFLEETARIRSDQDKGLARERHVLVIGGAGYVGNVLIRHLLERGYRVRCMDALLFGTGRTLADLLDHPRFTFQHGDLRNRKDVERALEQVTDVIHLAAMVGDPICKKYSALSRDINLTGAIRLFDGLNGRHLRKYVFTSTCSNYGIHLGDGLATEEAPLNPKSLYAETKVAFEQHVLGRADLDFHPIVLRLSTAFGLSPRMRFDLTVSEFTRDLALGRDLLVFDQDTWRPYCHVADISDCVMRALEAPAELVSRQVFNVGSSEQNFTKRMIVQEIQKLVPTGAVSYKQGGFDPRDYRVSFEKARRVLGFQPRHSVPQAIERLAHAIKSGMFDDVEALRGFYGNYVVRDGVPEVVAEGGEQ